MNKKILSTIGLTLIYSNLYAADASVTIPENTNSQTPSNPASSTTVAPQSINCQYHIPANNTNIDKTLVMQWTIAAVVQSFHFTPDMIDKQLSELQDCYTDLGWQGFNNALQKSGNINAIKSQQLSVNSQIDGTFTISPVQNSQWKVTLPLKVVYQNDKDKFTQLLSIDVLVGRKSSGDLGIMQIVASPLPSTNDNTQTPPTNVQNNTEENATQPTKSPEVTPATSPDTKSTTTPTTTQEPTDTNTPTPSQESTSTQAPTTNTTEPGALPSKEQPKS